MSRWGATKHTCSCSGALLLQSRFFLTVNLPVTLCVLCSIIPNMLLWVLAYIINDDFPLHFTYRIYRTSSILINQSELEVLYNNYYAGSICFPWSFSAPNCASLCQSLKIVSVNTHTTAYKQIFLLLFLLRSNILALWKIIYLLHSPQQMWPGVYVNFSRKMLVLNVPESSPHPSLPTRTALNSKLTHSCPYFVFVLAAGIRSNNAFTISPMSIVMVPASHRTQQFLLLVTAHSKTVYTRPRKRLYCYIGVLIQVSF